MYDVQLVRKAAKFLRSLPDNYRLTIKNEIGKLSTEPRPRECLQLSGRESCFRIRIGPFRIQYYVDEEQKEITVYKISRRDETTYN